MPTLFSLLLFSCLIPLTLSYETRSAPDPNIRWVTALVSGVGLGILCVIFLLIMSHFVNQFIKHQARMKVSSVETPAEDQGYHPTPTDKDSKEKYSYYNRGMETEEVSEVTRGRSSAQNPNVKFHNVPNSRVEMSSA